MSICQKKCLIHFFLFFRTPTQVLSEIYREGGILWHIIIITFYGTFILYHHCISIFAVHCTFSQFETINQTVV